MLLSEMGIPSHIDQETLLAHIGPGIQADFQSRDIYLRIQMRVLRAPVLCGIYSTRDNVGNNTYSQTKHFIVEKDLING
jgi:hypothetical protein